MNLVESVKEACDAIEERIYSLNAILEKNEENHDIIMELTSIVSLINDIQKNVDENNEETTRDELIAIQIDIYKLFEDANVKAR